MHPNSTPILSILAGNSDANEREMYGFTVGCGGVRYGRGSIVGGVTSGFEDVEKREGGKTEYLTNPARDLVESPTLSSIGVG